MMTFFFRYHSIFALKAVAITKVAFLKNQGFQNLQLLGVPFQQESALFYFCPTFGKKLRRPRKEYTTHFTIASLSID